MGKLIAGLAIGAFGTVLAFLAGTYVDIHWGIREEATAVIVEDPYRMRRVLGRSVEAFAYVTTALVYYALLGSLLLDRWRPFSAAAKAALLAVTCWLAMAAIAFAQVGLSFPVFLNIGLLLGLPTFCGVLAMLKVMSSNTSLERTREG